MNARTNRWAVGLLVALSLAGCSKDKGTNPAAAPLEMNSNVSPGGGQYSHRFFAEGAYPYHCTIHSSMSGVVVVAASVPAADSLQSVDITNLAFTPTTVSIPVGGKVTWTNSTAVTLHTVTSD